MRKIMHTTDLTNIFTRMAIHRATEGQLLCCSAKAGKKAIVVRLESESRLNWLFVKWIVTKNKVQKDTYECNSSTGIGIVDKYST